MSSTRLSWTYPACSIVNSPVLVISKCAFVKMGLESDTCFLDWRKTITQLDGFAELSSLVDDVVEMDW